VVGSPITDPAGVQHTIAKVSAVSVLTVDRLTAS
jgi:hypothetical protein